MTKATLTGGQVGAAVFAGIFGHLLFAAGWIILGLTLLGGTIAAILGGTVSSIGDGAEIFATAGGVLGGIVLGFVIASVVLLLLAVVVSGLILRGGRVRKPWGTTWTAVIISALIDVPLLLAYLAIARSTDGIPFPLIALVGTVVVGILIWLWMTWAHRGPAVVEAEAIATKPVDPSIDVKRD